jgi:hypothetical protein
MEAVYAPPSILRLTGVRLADYVSLEDFADARLRDAPEAAAPEAPPEEPPDRIPETFTGLGAWPLRTNLRCWACGFTFDDRPKFVPTYVREAEGRGVEFGVRGNMCTFNCAELWIETHLGARASNEERWRAQDALCLVYFLFTGRRVARIQPAPSKTELRQYGGDWDEETFWRRLRELDPVAGLRDHTPGSVVPERERAQVARAILAAGRLGTPARTCAPALGRLTVWDLCGVPAPAPVFTAYGTTTPAPATPAPALTPAPATPAPATPAPVTPAPATPAPVTPAPATPVPVEPQELLLPSCPPDMDILDWLLS